MHTLGDGVRNISALICKPYPPPVKLQSKQPSKAASPQRVLEHHSSTARKAVLVSGLTTTQVKVSITKVQPMSPLKGWLMISQLLDSSAQEEMANKTPLCLFFLWKVADNFLSRVPMVIQDSERNGYLLLVTQS